MANNLAVVAEQYFNSNPAESSIVGAWLGSVCFSLQIFYDFSGYSDMAIGLGRMFGFIFDENFNYPYMAGSITDFWRRWHISLSRWFRDYVYIPLGGSRVSVARHIINMGIVWILTGIWHGADYSFIVWGIMYFMMLVVEKYIVKPEEKKHKLFMFLYRIICLLAINFAWVIFNANGLTAGIKYCLSMFGVYYKNIIIDAVTIYMLREYGVFVITGIIFSTPFMKWLANSTERYPIVERFVFPMGYLLGFVWGISFLILGAHNPFIYFNF